MSRISLANSTIPSSLKELDISLTSAANSLVLVVTSFSYVILKF
jgi:hypothetical protein